MKKRLRKKLRKNKHGYMCGVDFQHEVEYASGGNFIHPSIEDLKRCRKCWSRCGIVKVRIVEERWVQPQDFGE